MQDLIFRNFFLYDQQVLLLLAHRTDDTIKLAELGEANIAFVFAGPGDDLVEGSDLVEKAVVFGGTGDDTYSAGSGNSKFFGGFGDDTAIFKSEIGAGGTNYYNGGTGTDTLELHFTADEWAGNAEVRADVQSYASFFQNAPERPNGWGWHWLERSEAYSFSFTDLTVKDFEILKVIVNGVEIDPLNDAPVAVDLSSQIEENSPIGTVVGTVAASDAPVAEDQAYSVFENGSVRLDLLAGATDPDGDALTLDAISQPADGLIVASFVFGIGTVYDYVPDADFNGSDSFTYTVDDSNGGTDTANVVVTIIAVDDFIA